MSYKVQDLTDEKVFVAWLEREMGKPTGSQERFGFNVWKSWRGEQPQYLLKCNVSEWSSYEYKLPPEVGKALESQWRTNRWGTFLGTLTAKSILKRLRDGLGKPDLYKDELAEATKLRLEREAAEAKALKERHLGNAHKDVIELARKVAGEGYALTLDEAVDFLREQVGKADREKGCWNCMGIGDCNWRGCKHAESLHPELVK